MSSETVGQSRESLARGAGILNDISTRGVVKEEPEDEESNLLLQIEAPVCALLTIHVEFCPSVQGFPGVDLMV